MSAPEVSTQATTPPTVSPTTAGTPTLPVTSTSPKTPGRTTVKLSDLLKVDSKKDKVATVSAPTQQETNEYTLEQLNLTWIDFAEQRKKYQAEYQLLTQPYDLKDNRVVVHLLSPVQETMLNNLKTELTTYLREKLKNSSILIVGEVKESDDKKMMYTSRDKFEYLLEKNPALRELKERLGLDPDF